MLLEAQEVAKLSTNGLICEFCEQAHENGTCLPLSFGLSNEQVRYMESYVGQEGIFYLQEWPEYHPAQWEDQDENEDMSELE